MFVILTIVFQILIDVNQRKGCFGTQINDLRFAKEAAVEARDNLTTNIGYGLKRDNLGSPIFDAFPIAHGDINNTFRLAT